MKVFIGALFVVLCSLLVLSAPSQEAKTKPVKYPRGRVASPPEVVAARHAAAFKRHGHRMKSLPDATPDTFDCQATFGCVLPVNDQGQCGDCYGVSACDGMSMAFAKAGYFKVDGSQRLTFQWGLDCKSSFGGCNGGDEAEVIDFGKTTGFPIASDYGPYLAAPGRCKSIAGMKVWKIGDWGYCTPGQHSGVASTQDMKNAMVRYGPLSVAFDAGGCDNYQVGQVMTAKGSNVDHAVLCVGWKTEGGKTIWKGMNQWGTSWGDKGYFWIQEGAYSWGTEAIWMSVAALPPPPGPTPPPPIPPAPIPPGPSLATINGMTINYSDGTSSVLKVVPNDSEVIHGGMSLNEVMDAIDRIRKKSPEVIPGTLPKLLPKGPSSEEESRIERLEKALDRIGGK